MVSEKEKIQNQIKQMSVKLQAQKEKTKNQSIQVKKKILSLPSADCKVYQ